MGDVLHLSSLVLYDRWPGPVNMKQGIPTDGWDSTTQNFKIDTSVTSKQPQPAHPLGTKISAYTDNTYCAGWYTMIYLMFHDQSNSTTGYDISADFSEANIFVSHVDGSHAMKYQSDISANPWYVVGTAIDSSFTDATEGSPVAIACFTHTADSSEDFAAGNPYENNRGDAYGWFWCGGVCPCEDATLLQGLAGKLYGAGITVDNLMRKGPVMYEITENTPYLINTDVSNFDDATTLDNNVVLTNIATAIGYACASAS